MKKNYIVLISIIGLLISCNSKFSKYDAFQLIKKHYEMEKTKAGGGMEVIDTLAIIKFDDTNLDTPKASFQRIGYYSPNQVPGAPPSSPINDTANFKFYKKEGKWEWKYAFK